ncbi:MAG: MAPEG family protein [Parvularculaceae bacterium]
MTPTAMALLGFVLWTILLVGFLAIYRSGVVMGGGKKSNQFQPSGDDLTGFGRRLTRAHANCYESLPIAGSVMLYAIATNQTVITDGLALPFLGARLLQSLTHLISTSETAVLFRFVFFLVQVGIVVFWILKLAHLF